MSRRPTPAPLTVAWLALLASACGAPTSAGPASPGPAASPAVQPRELRDRVEALAADSMLGREAGTLGEARAARYLTREVERLGLRPLGGAGYLHPVPLARRFVAARVRHRGPGGVTPLTADDVVPVSGIVGLPGTSRTRGAGPVVYAGYLFDPAVGSGELRLDQLRDAVVVLRAGPAPGVSPASGPRLPVAALLSPGSPAAAVMIVEDGADRGIWEYATEVAREGVVELAGGREKGDGPAFFLIRPEAVDRLLGDRAGDARTPRTGLGHIDFTIEERIVDFEAHNVAAALPGSDPRLAGEYVALGAHYDHVGVGAPVDGDSIYNGADDDASGSSALLEIAERFATLPAAERPRRSLLFVWHTAEESGLLGSERFTNRPPVPLEAIVAQVNLDMIGRNGPDTLFLVGSRRLSTELGDLVEEVNRARGDPFVLDYSYDRPGHPEQVYCRSDHYNYARFGIPVVFFTSGLHDDYHQPSDEPHRLDYSKLARVTGLVGDLARALADREARPRVDQAVPPAGARCTG